jgi:hypothetical protein
VRTNLAPVAQTRELKRIVRGLPDLEIRRIIVRRPPRDYRRRGTIWLVYEINAGESVAFVHGRWQALLISGILRAQSRTRHWPAVRGDTWMMVLANGKKREDTEGLFGNAFRGTVHQASEDRITAIVQRTSQDAGVRLDGVRFAHPLGRSTPEISVITSDPQGFARNAAEEALTIERPLIRPGPDGGPLVEGVYLYVKSAQGNWVYVSGYGVRLEAGVSTTNSTRISFGTAGSG